MPRSQGIKEHNLKIWSDEREIIIPSIPNDNLRVLLRLIQYFLVVYTRVYSDAFFDERFEFLPLLDSTRPAADFRHFRKSPHRREIAVCHGMPDHGNFYSRLL